jgi:hypothetical protein
MTQLEQCKEGSQWTFQEQEKGIVEEKVNELESKSRLKIIRDLRRGINYFKKGYEPRTYKRTKGVINMQILIQM